MGDRLAGGRRLTGGDEILRPRRCLAQGGCLLTGARRARGGLAAGSRRGVTRVTGVTDSGAVQRWDLLGERVVLDGFRRVLSRRYRMPSGTESDWEILDGGRTVAVEAVTEEGRVLLVRQFRPGPGRILLEIPGGYVEQGESVEDAAARELLEETGFKAGSLEVVGKSWLSATATNERYAVVARDCRWVAEPTPDVDEFIELVELSMSDFLQHALSGHLTDADIALRALVALNVLNPTP